MPDAGRQQSHRVPGVAAEHVPGRVAADRGEPVNQSVSVFLLTEPRTHAIVFMFLFTNPTNRKFSVKAVF